MKKKIYIIGGLLVILLIFVGAFIFIQSRDSKTNKSLPFAKTESAAVKAGKKLSGEKCEGQGSKKLGALPMDEESFSSLDPYGVMIGSHVTPIDHMYFEPKDRESAINAYNVYAPGDGTITEIQRRVRDDSTEVKEEFRLVIAYTCTFLSYYDLITVLDPGIYEKASDLDKGDFASVEIPVKEGQIIGKIGKQTLDFAIWDTEKPLSGFVKPGSYEAEPWKIYTANPFDYFTDEINKILLKKNLRTTDPVQGKIDYDIEGKLVGNWFKKGTNGYAGANQEKYYEGHMSVVYNHLDPKAIIVSIGDFDGESKQMAVKGNKPDPAGIDVESGLVKYELYNFQYVGTKDKHLGDSVGKNAKVEIGQELFGTVLFQLQDNGELKMETFPGKIASEVTGFKNNTRIYER